MLLLSFMNWFQFSYLNILSITILSIIIRILFFCVCAFLKKSILADFEQLGKLESN